MITHFMWLEIHAQKFTSLSNYSIVLAYIFMYIFYVSVLLYVFKNYPVLDSKKFRASLNFLSTHSRIYLFFLLNLLLGTPPFFIFWFKLYFFIQYLHSNQFLLAIFLAGINLIVSYVYLQNFFFLKKTNASKHPKNTFRSFVSNETYTLLTWLIYINGLAVIYFPFYIIFFL